MKHLPHSAGSFRAEADPLAKTAGVVKPGQRPYMLGHQTVGQSLLVG